MDNMKDKLNTLNPRSRIVKIGARRLQNTKTKFCALLLFSVIIVGLFALSPTFSSLMNTVVINSTGRVSLSSITAKSGSAVDIQAAVNAVASQGGGDVYIPAGTWNFTPVGVWATVNVPAGVNIFGAPNQRFANGSNVGWNTVLVQTWNVPSGDLAPGAVYRTWFSVTGTKPTRISDFELEGYGTVNQAFNSTIWYLVGIALSNVLDFRVDHMFFSNVRSGGVRVLTTTANAPTRGVIDHCSFINTGDPYPGYGTNPFLPGYNDYNHRTVDYGIMPYGSSMNTAAMWDSNITDILGQYTNYTVIIENNVFSEWRHDVSAIDGMSFVFRFNIVYGDNGAGTIDGHGTYVHVPTRSMEIYNNTFLDPNRIYEIQPTIVNARGGGGVFFNNTERDYLYDIFTIAEDPGDPFPQGIPGSSGCPWYAWGNTNLPLTSDDLARNGTHKQNPTLESGLGIVNSSVMPNYTPYPYPAPLTLEASS